MSWCVRWLVVLGFLCVTAPALANPNPGPAPSTAPPAMPSRSDAPTRDTTTVEDLAQMDVGELAEQVSSSARRIDTLEGELDELNASATTLPTVVENMTRELHRTKTMVDAVKLPVDCEAAEARAELQSMLDGLSVGGLRGYAYAGMGAQGHLPPDLDAAVGWLEQQMYARSRPYPATLQIDAKAPDADAIAICKQNVLRLSAILRDLKNVETSLGRAGRDAFSQAIDTAQTKLQLERQRKAKLINELRNRPAAGFAIDKLPLVVVFLGVFSLAIMVMVQRFRPEIQARWVDTGQVIQFMTVTVLIIVVLVLGLAGVLKGETVGTLIGAIGGYVLSQGIGRALQSRAERAERRSEEAQRDAISVKTGTGEGVTQGGKRS